MYTFGGSHEWIGPMNIQNAATATDHTTGLVMDYYGNFTKYFKLIS